MPRWIRWQPRHGGSSAGPTTFLISEPKGHTKLERRDPDARPSRAAISRQKGKPRELALSQRSQLYRLAEEQESRCPKDIILCHNRPLLNRSGTNQLLSKRLCPVLTGGGCSTVVQCDQSKLDVPGICLRGLGHRPSNARGIQRRSHQARIPQFFLYY